MYGCFPACVSVCCVHAVPAQTGKGCSGAGVTDGCELSSGCWEPKLSPLEEQPEPGAAKPSLQPLYRTLQLSLLPLRPRLPQLECSVDLMSAVLQPFATKSQEIGSITLRPLAQARK